MTALRRLAPVLVGLLVLAPTAALVPLAGLAAVAFGASGCTTLQQIAALRQVDFRLDRVADGFLAGVDIDRVQHYGDLRATDIARLTAAAARGELPLSFVLHLDATNPEANSVPARLVQLDWTLLVDGTETVSGVYNDERLIEPGTTADIPVGIELDLVRFFDDNAADLINLALNLAGAGGSPSRLSLRARPTVNTAIGPITYPGFITISHTVGG